MKISPGSIYSGDWSLRGNFLWAYVGNQKVELRNQVKSVEPLAFEHDKGKNGVGGAAVGAVAGALLAGPLGLMAGSLMGAKAGKREASDTFRVQVTLVSGSSFIAAVSPTELQGLQKLAEQTA